MCVNNFIIISCNKLPATLNYDESDKKESLQTTSFINEQDYQQTVLLVNDYIEDNNLNTSKYTLLSQLFNRTIIFENQATSSYSDGSTAYSSDGPCNSNSSDGPYISNDSNGPYISNSSNGPCNSNISDDPCNSNSSDSPCNSNSSDSLYDNRSALTTTLQPSTTTATQPLSGTPFIVFTIVICLLSAFGAIGNLISMYVYYPRGRQGNVYVFFLSCIDFIMAGVIMPCTISVLAGLMNLVQLYLFAIALILIVLLSICILVSISIDRYIACCYPQLYNKTQRYAKLIITFEIIFNVIVLGLAFWRPLGTNIFNFLSRVIIIGSFLLIVILYTKIFIVLRRRMVTIIPQPTAPPMNQVSMPSLLDSNRQASLSEDNCRSTTSHFEDKCHGTGITADNATTATGSIDNTNTLPCQSSSKNKELVFLNKNKYCEQGLDKIKVNSSHNTNCTSNSTDLNTSQEKQEYKRLSLDKMLAYSLSEMSKLSINISYTPYTQDQFSIDKATKPIEQSLTDEVTKPIDQSSIDKASKSIDQASTDKVKVPTLINSPIDSAQRKCVQFAKQVSNSTAIQSISCIDDNKRATDERTNKKEKDEVRKLNIIQMTHVSEHKNVIGRLPKNAKHLVNAHARLTATRTRNLLVTIKMFIAVTVVFIFSFLPSYLIQYNVLPISRTYAFTYFLNHIANPLIYFIINKSYRDRTRKLFGIICPCVCQPPNQPI